MRVTWQRLVASTSPQRAHSRVTRTAYVDGVLKARTPSSTTTKAVACRICGRRRATAG